MADHPLAAIVRRLRGATDTPDSDHQLLRRFAERRDEAAFAELVRRHGPTVWGVCRRGVPDPNDAEDVFQTTFLVLAKKPTAVGPGHSLGGWLHGVAVRASAQARRGIVRRFAREAEAARRHAERSPNSPDGGWLDEEVRTLPARYRDPLVLCHLRGLGVAEAADELGCPANTLKTRLARGREMLKERLTRRGIAAPAGVLALSVPAELGASTIQLATNPAAAAPQAVLELVSATLPGGLSMKLQLLAAALVLACGAALTGVAVPGPPAIPAEKENPPAIPENPAGGAAKSDTPAGEVAKPLARVDAEGVVSGKDLIGGEGSAGMIIVNKSEEPMWRVVIGGAGQPACRIVKVQDGKLAPATFDDLQVGSRVQVMVQGGLWLKATPLIGRAEEIRIVVPPKPVSLRGAVKMIDTAGKGTTLRVDGEKAEDAEHSGAFVVTVPPTADVLQFVDGKFVNATPEAFSKAARVEVVFDDTGVRESYPMQATAKAVRILADGVKK